MKSPLRRIVWKGRFLPGPTNSHFKDLRVWFARHPNATFLLLSACWVLLFYGRALSGAFVYDDTSAIQANPALNSWSAAPRYFQTVVPLSGDYRGFAGTIYRPLVWLTFIFDRHIWGLNPFGFHLLNLLLHWANGALAFRLLRMLRVPALLAGSACLVWLGLPITSEAVAWISGRHTLLATFFILLSATSAVSAARTRRASAFAGFGFSLAGALFSNEWGILALPLSALVLYFDRTRESRRSLPALALLAFLVTASCFAAKQAAGGQLPLHSPALWATGLTFFKYLSWMLLPLQMSVERSSDVPANGLSASTLLALLGVCALAALAFVLRRGLPLVAAGIAWLLLAIVPFCGVVFIYQGMAERYTYLASQGLVLALVAAAFQLNIRWRPLVFAIGLAWIGWGTWRLEARLGDWQNETALFESSLRATPRSAVLLYNLGVEAAGRGHTAQAIDLYRRALDNNPDYTGALINLGNLLSRDKQYAAAQELLVRAIALDPASPDPWVDLGNTFFRSGSVLEAKTAYLKALALRSDDAEALVNLGAVYQKLGDPAAAQQQLQEALKRLRR